MQKNSTKPLYVRLNEERTQGEMVQNRAELCINGIPVLLGCSTVTDAAYTALAVNNLAKLADALDTVLARLGTFTESSAFEPEDQDAYDEGIAALEAIS